MKDSPPGESGDGGLVTGLGDGDFTTQHVKPLSLPTREVDPDSKIQIVFWVQVWLMPASKETLRMNEEMSRIEPALLALAGRFFTTSTTWEAQINE